MAQYDRLPWFKFFAVDWMTDPLVRSLNLAQRGLFLDLLCIQWREGFLPEHENAIRRICGVGVKQWLYGGGDTEIWIDLETSPRENPPLYDFIDEAFPVGDDGSRRNQKLERIRAELIAGHEARSKGGKARFCSSAKAEHKLSTVDSDTDSDVDPPTGEKKGDSDAAIAAIGSRYVRGEGDVVWFQPDGSLDWAKTVTDELQKHFPAMTRQLSRRGGDWLSELRSLSSWHATAPKSKRKRVSAQRWLFGRLFRRLELGAVHAEHYQPKGNGKGIYGLEHPPELVHTAPVNLEIFERHQKRAEESAVKLKAWREERPPEGMPVYKQREWWEEHKRRRP